MSILNGSFGEKKNFPLRWREWVEQAMTGSRVDINLNGELELFQDI
jgi:hypothetical protein